MIEMEKLTKIEHVHGSEDLLAWCETCHAWIEQVKVCLDCNTSAGIKDYIYCQECNTAIARSE